MTEPAAVGAGRPSFSERQLAWIRATTSEAEVAANLRGRSVVRAPSGPPDELAQVMVWLGVPFVGMGCYVFAATGSNLGLMPAVLGALLLAVALVRWALRARARARPEIEVMTIVPVFTERTKTDADDVPYTFRVVTARGGPASPDELVWPSRLHAIGETLAGGERVRVGVVRRDGSRYIAWAHPAD